MHFHGFPPRTAELLATGQIQSTGKFGRLLPFLDPLRVDEDVLRRLASRMLESVGGTDDNPAIPAAYTYFGQFVDHNITFDTTTLEEARLDPAAVVNYRAPRFDLDSVYGGGPVAQPHLYQRDFPELFQIGCAKRFKKHPDTGAIVTDQGLTADLPRGWNRFALIADPRNDENFIVAQMHLAFLLFHNRIVEWLQEDPTRRRAPLHKSIFAEARDLAVRHYQWVILHDFLPRIAGEETIGSVLRDGSMLGRGGSLFMPVEFSAAAYRFGHSTVRPAYNVSKVVKRASLKGLFDFSGNPRGKGKVPIPERWIIEWFRLLHMDPSLPNTLARRIDPYLSDDLAAMPAPGGRHESLAALNLLRGNLLGLPSGQSVAGYFGYQVLTPDEIAQGPDGEVARDHDLHRDTPLWYYVLKEALIRCGGVRLGPTGARIVAEVFIGLLALDENSILSRARSWQPVFPYPPQDTFRLGDLLRFTGVLADGGPGPALRQSCGYPLLHDCFSNSKRPDDPAE